MRIKDVRKVWTYFERIVKDPFSKQSKAAMKRYLGEGFALVYERIRGLDFTMVYQCEESENNNNYSKSPKKILRQVFEDIDFDRPHGFLDMGCGKGYVMTVAASYPFEKIGGVEYTQELCEICKKNLEHLHLEQVEVFHEDAKYFDKYADYDIFYFCNPFDETILSAVAKRIIESHQNEKCYIYYLNPNQEQRQKAITDAGFKLVKKIENENEKYFNINIYTNEEE